MKTLSRTLRTGGVCLAAICIPLGMTTSAHATEQVYACSYTLDEHVANFSGEENTVTGTITYTSCTSVTQPSITHGTATIEGSATGSPGVATINEHDEVTWFNASNQVVGTSVINRERTFAGVPTLMVESDPSASLVSGLFSPNQVSINAGTATRTCASGDVAPCTYHNESDEV
ncbi:hypothetical protein ABZ942_40015 [Nocardia sp. NPDC046473]|uniref:hypothetical protein n=1 Tax=Nocardia sp. NPDC046473 TaxID=3155733 RepID=UPI0033ED35BB